MRQPKRRLRERDRRAGGPQPTDRSAIVPTPADRSARAKDLNNQGFALIRDGHPRQAIIELREAIRLDPTLPGAHNNLGIAWQLLGGLDAAAVEYRAAIRLEPGSYPARVNLAHLLRDGLHDHVAAAAEFREALRLRPGDAALLERMAQALEWAGHPREAAIAYDAFVRDVPAAATAAVRFGAGSSS